MSLMVDPGLDWIFIPLAGQSWPQLDEDALRAFANTCDAFVDTAASALADVGPLAESVLANLSGSSARAFRRYSRSLDGQGDSFTGGVTSLSELLREYALNGEAAKYSILTQVIFTGVRVLWALSSPFTAPLVPAFIAAGRMMISQFFSRYLGQVGATLALAAIEESVQEFAQAFLVQLIQVLQGHTGFDGLSLAVSAGVGLGAGVFAAGLATAAAGGFAMTCPDGAAGSPRRPWLGRR